MALTLETVSCPNSPSGAARSSCSRSKISFPSIMAGALTDQSSLIRSVVGKLQVDPEVVCSQHGNHFLQCIAVFAADPHQISLDRGLCFFLGVLYQFLNLACFFDC